MIIETKVVGQRAELADRELELPYGRRTLGSLLAELVRIEVRDHDRRRDDQLLLRVLTPADVAQGFTKGRFVSGGRDVPPAPPVDQAVDRALEAFRDGLFLVSVDSAPVEDLDAEIEVRSETRLRLVRVVALAGG